MPSITDEELNPPQKVLRRRLGPAGREAAVRQREREELRDLKEAAEAAEAARAEAEAERLRLDALFREQQAAAWAAKLAEQKARERAQELEALRLEHVAAAAADRSRAAELDAQLAAVRKASEAAAKRHEAALRTQLNKVEKELRDSALHTGRPSTQARWAIGVVKSLARPEPEPEPEPAGPSPALTHQPVALATSHKQPASKAATAAAPPKRARKTQAPRQTAPLSVEQQQTVRDKYSGEGGEEKAAAFLQSIVRGAAARREAERRERCTRVLQAAMRGWQGRRAAARERSAAATRSKAEQELFDRMAEIAQRSGLRPDWRKSRSSVRQPEPQLEPELRSPPPQQMLLGARSAMATSGLDGAERRARGTRRRRSSRPQTPEPPLATTFAGLQPRWRPSSPVAAVQPVPAVRSTQRGHRRPATAEGSLSLGRDEVFPDVRFPGGQVRRPPTAESEAMRAARERQRLQDTAAAFGFAGMTHARRRERKQRRHVRKWDGKTTLALPPRKGKAGTPTSPHNASPFSPEHPHALSSQQPEFTQDDFSDPSIVLDEKLAAESEAMLVSLSQARVDYDQASVGLGPRNPHTYIFEYPDGSMDMFGGGGVAVGPDEGMCFLSMTLCVYG
jgi:hypothetical protein